jgi:hypothetical protein
VTQKGGQIEEEDIKSILFDIFVHRSPFRRKGKDLLWIYFWPLLSPLKTICCKNKKIFKNEHREGLIFKRAKANYYKDLDII